jgi:UPF0716 protein FxsA
MRRRVPWWAVALLFVVLPLVEIYVIVQLGQVVGPWWTILILIGDGALGAWLMKREGSRAWRALQEALRARRMPSRELADGALVLIGGTLLLTPGFVTDAIGLICVLPFTRPLMRGVLTGLITRRLVGVTGVTATRPGPFPGRGGPTARGHGRAGERPYGRDDVVAGEVVEDDDRSGPAGP